MSSAEPLQDAHDLSPVPTRDLAIVVGAYALAILVGTGAALLTPSTPMFQLLAGTCAATLVVWVASAVTRNASMYDAYWSVAPLVMALGLLATALGHHQDDAGSAHPLRAGAAVLLVTLWALRLTANWFRGWGGLRHEDWRYVRIQARTGSFWQPVNFLGIHLMPSLMTWAGTLPLIPILLLETRAPGPLDLVACAIAATGIWLEWRADEDLHAFRRQRSDASELLDKGIWSRCRHPNYLGEMLFWWGLAGLALAADTDNWPWAAGALAITALFVLVSIPLIENRMLERKPGYAAYRARVPLLLPWPRRRASA